MGKTDILLVGLQHLQSQINNNSSVGHISNSHYITTAINRFNSCWPNSHIEAATKWPLSHRQHFQNNVHQWKPEFHIKWKMNFKQNFMWRFFFSKYEGSIQTNHFKISTCKVYTDLVQGRSTSTQFVHAPHYQGWFQACTQVMRGIITK